MAERERRPEAVGPLWVLLSTGSEVTSEGHAIVKVESYADVHGMDVVLIVPTGGENVVSLRLNTKQAYSLAMSLLRVRAAVTRALKRASN